MPEPVQSIDATSGPLPPAMSVVRAPLPGDEAASAAVARDRRKAGEARYVTILLVARLVHGAREDLCRIRNISSGGLMLETAAPLAPGDAVSIELRNMQVVTGRVVWHREQRSGVQFDHPIDVSAMLATPPKPREGEPMPRAPRVATACPVELRRAGKTLHAVVRDLSQTGCRLTVEQPLAVDERIFINIPGLEPRRAVIRWAARGVAGAGFVDTLAFAHLSAWLSDDRVRFSWSSPDAAARN